LLVNTKVKVAAGLAAAGVLAYVLYRRFKGGPGKQGSVLLGEYTTIDCGCFYMTYYADGTNKSEKRPRSECVGDGLSFEGCTTTGVDWFDDVLF
jgi:hypothetical protein